MIWWYPTEAQRAAAIFECAYDAYAHALAAHGRVPASREVVLEEARQSPTLSPVAVLYRKRARLEP